MSTNIYESGPITVTRFAGPASLGADRRRYQVTIYGETDNCGRRMAWVTLSPDEMRRLIAALNTENLG